MLKWIVLELPCEAFSSNIEDVLFAVLGKQEYSKNITTRINFVAWKYAVMGVFFIPALYNVG